MGLFPQFSCRKLAVVAFLIAFAGIVNAGPGNYNQQGPKLVAIPAPPGDEQQVEALSGSGDTAVIGGWVFTRSGGVWTQQQALRAGAVALSGDGNTAVVGGTGGGIATGSVAVFTQSNGVWTQQGGELVGTGDAYPGQGSAVAISADGNTLAEAAQVPSGNHEYLVWIFARSGGTWSQQGGKLVVPSLITGLSLSLSADGNTLATCCALSEFEDIGTLTASVFTRSAGRWTAQATGLVTYDYFIDSFPIDGVHLTGDGNTLLSNGVLFSRKGGVWSQSQNQGVGGYGPYAISADGGTIAAGPFRSYLSFPTNKIVVFVQSGGVWTLQGTYTGSGAVEFKLGDSMQGHAVMLSANGNTMLESGPDDNGSTGATWVFATPQLATTITDSGNFHRGQIGASYTITVSNTGDRDIHAAPTSAINVIDKLPSGLTPTGIFGGGWTCTLASVSCTRDDGLVMGDSLPPITVIVSVANNAPSSVTNVATASGGGSNWGNAKDVTAIAP